VRIKESDGGVSEKFDIREPVRIELEYEVLRSDEMMLPYLTLTNEEGVRIFSAVDLDCKWRGKARKRGRYISTAWIPGNFLSEGVHFVGAAMKTTAQKGRYFYERDAAVFRVIDTLSDDTARGHYSGRLTGVVRPQLRWETQFDSQG
jgi:lipopolysaccharide transport system ATP-binding protein